MEVVHPRCAGIDIGKRSLTVCVIRSDPSGEPVKETRTFRTLTRDLFALADWLDERGVTAVAMEATGSYWKPIWNLLEDRFELLLANAAHLKAVPGRAAEIQKVNSRYTMCSSHLRLEKLRRDKHVREQTRNHFVFQLHGVCHSSRSACPVDTNRHKEADDAKGYGNERQRQ